MCVPRKALPSFLLTLLLLLALGIAPLRAESTDPFNGAAQSFDAKPQDAVNYNAGDWGVSEQRGAATYTYAINVPPGRNSMAPALALRYSSQSPLRGGLAAGWTMTLPSVQLDYSAGYEQGTHIYRASLGSANGRLVEVTEPSPYPRARAYRIDYDNTFTRFFHLDKGGWAALTQDGVRYYFEEDGNASDAVSVWHLTREADPFGNTVRYLWQKVMAPYSGAVIDYSLKRIEYTANDRAGLGPHAKLEFTYAPLDFCTGSDIPVGAAAELNGKVSGASRLNTIQISTRATPDAAWQLRKEISLTYKLYASRLYIAQPVVSPPDKDPSIGCRQAPLRYLTQIDTTAYAPDGTATTLPSVQFKYNSRTIGPYVPTYVPNPGPLLPPADPAQTLDSPGYANYGTRRGADGTLLDLDSDGVADRVSIIVENKVCTLVWQRGLAGGTFESTVHKSPLPTAPWYNEMLDPPHPERGLLSTEGCNLNGQTAYRPRRVLGSNTPQPERGVVSYHFLDYTGDGRIDLLTNVWAGLDHASYVPGAQPAQDAVQAATDPPLPPPPLSMTPESPYHGVYVWRVYRNGADPDGITYTGHAFASRPIEVHSPVALPPSASDETLDTAVLPNSILPSLFDLDGDGFLDVIDIGSSPNLIGWNTDGCDAIKDPTPSWCVYFGHGGADFSKGYDWPVPKINLSQDNGGETTDSTGRKHKRQRTVALLRDFDGDGLPDLVVQEADGKLRAYLNNGQAFPGVKLDLGLSAPIEEVQTDYKPESNSAVIDGHRGYRRRLIDLDGDKLPDMIYFVDQNANDANDITQQHKVMAAFNVGGRFAPVVELPAEWNRAKRLFTAGRYYVADTTGRWWITNDFFDATGDGHADLVDWTRTTMRVVARPGLPAAPDLLQTVENGRGMRVTFSYAPSTLPDAVQGAGNGGRAHLPAPKWVVTQVKTEGGFGTPPQVSHYVYADPVFLPPGEYTGYVEPAHFFGFGKATTTADDAKGAPARRVVRTFLYGQRVVIKGAAIEQIISPSGATAQQWTYLADSGKFQLYEYVKNNWKREALFAGRSFFTHLDQSLTRTCDAQSDDAQCMAQTGNVERKQETWTPVNPGQNSTDIVRLQRKRGHRTLCTDACTNRLRARAKRNRPADELSLHGAVWTTGHRC